MKTLNAAAYGPEPRPAPNWSVDFTPAAAVPWLSEVRDDTVPLTLNLAPFTSVASGNFYPLTYTWPPQ